MDQPAIPFDLVRMLLGEQEPLFLAEIVLRTVLIYLYTLTLLRWVGGRTVAQLSMVEFLLVIALGSAVGDSLFYPDVPLLPAMVAITMVVLLNKLIDLAILRWHRAKRIVDGMPRQVMSQGRILVDTLRRDSLGVDEFTSQLRDKGVRNLGEVESAYLEADGRVSLFKWEPRPGLPIVPPPEITPPPAWQAGPACCVQCGALHGAERARARGKCPDCGSDAWTAPV